MTIKIRPATTTVELQAVLDLALQYVDAAKYFQHFGLVTRQRMADQVALVQTSGVHLVAWTEDEEAVGLISALIAPFPFTGEPVGQILLWYADGRYRRTGLGLNLLRLMEATLATRGVLVIQTSLPLGSPAKGILDRRQYAALETTHLKRLVPNGTT